MEELVLTYGSEFFITPIVNKDTINHLSPTSGICVPLKPYVLLPMDGCSDVGNISCFCGDKGLEISAREKFFLCKIHLFQEILVMEGQSVLL